MNLISVTAVSDVKKVTITNLAVTKLQCSSQKIDLILITNGRN